MPLTHKSVFINHRRDRLLSDLHWQFAEFTLNLFLSHTYTYTQSDIYTLSNHQMRAHTSNQLMMTEENSPANMGIWTDIYRDSYTQQH